MRKKTPLGLKIVGIALTVAVATPLGSWADARAPLAVQASIGSPAGKPLPAFHAHSRVRRLHRDSVANHGNWSRTLTASLPVSDIRDEPRLEDRPALSAVADPSPPDIPPA